MFLIKKTQKIVTFISYKKDRMEYNFAKIQKNESANKFTISVLIS